MAIKHKVEKLAKEKNNPCLTISLNTHRTHPDNEQDKITLKNLVKEAEDRIINEFGKRPAAALLEKLETLEEEIDVDYNLDSLHIFLSNDTQEIIKSAWPSNGNYVHISDTFAIRPLIKAYNRSEEYFILLISQSGTHLYEALNDTIVQEYKNEDFPFSQNKHYNTHHDKGTDPKHLDDLVREYLNKVDKAVQHVHNETDLQCVVVCTEDNYSRLMQVAGKPDIYHGYANINYNNTTTHYLAEQGWEIIKELQHERRTKAIGDMKEAVAHGNVFTDLQEIYQAAIDGRGELLIMHQDYAQPVLMTGERTFSLETDTTKKGVIDDITSNIAREILSKNGDVIFTNQDEIKDLGDIVLKVRY